MVVVSTGFGRIFAPMSRKPGQKMVGVARPKMRLCKVFHFFSYIGRYYLVCPYDIHAQCPASLLSSSGCCKCMDTTPKLFSFRLIRLGTEMN